MTAPSSSARLPRVSRRIAWTSALIHGLVHASVLLLPTVLGDLQRAFRVSLLDVLGVANIMYLAFGVSAVPAGYLADRLGSRAMLTVAAAGCTVALAMVALAPVFAGLFAARLGWRWGFAVAAVMAGACALLTHTLPPDEPRPAPPLPFRQSAVALGRTVAGFWASRPLRWLLLATIAGGFVYRGVLTFLPLHLAGSAGGMLGGSYVTSLVLLAGIVAQRFGGELADRLPRERLFLAEMALSVPVLLLLGLTSGIGLLALALTFGFLWYLAQPLASAIAAAHSDVRDHGLFFGVQFAASFGLGSFATTLGGLVTRGSGGTGPAFVCFGLVALVPLVAALFLLRSVRSAGAVAPVQI